VRTAGEEGGQRSVAVQWRAVKIKEGFLGDWAPLLDRLLQHERQSKHDGGGRTMSKGLNRRQSGSIKTTTSEFGFPFCSQWMMLMGLLYGRYESFPCAPQVAIISCMRESTGGGGGGGAAPCPTPARGACSQ
jgi:hypothetical protein